MTHYDVWSGIEGCIGDTDDLLKIVESKTLLSGLDMSTYKQVHWPNISYREVWMGQEREEGP